MKPVLISLISLILVSFSVNAQDGGTLYPSVEADQLYGPATNVLSLSVKQFEKIASIAEKQGSMIWFWFNASGTEITISGQADIILYSTCDGKGIGTNGRGFLITKIRELLSVNPSGSVLLQIRNDGVFSVQVEETVLEKGTPCPPFCD